LCQSLNDLAAKKIDVEEAKAQATLAKQINNVLNYNLDKVNLKLKLQNGQNQALFSEIEQ
jgi:hypothetical protein